MQELTRVSSEEPPQPRRFAAGVRAFALVVLLAIPIGATAAGVADPVPAHEVFALSSRVLGESRTVVVHLPRDYASSRARYPVLYMPDGGLDEDFPHVVAAVEALTAQHAIREVIVVGVPNTERRRDLTPPTQIEKERQIAPHAGGSAAFRRFFRDELIPAIDRRYRTTRERAIIGESLAGLFIVETVLREPDLFDHAVAFDPSLWWNRAALVKDAPALIRAMAKRSRGDARPRWTLYLAASRDDIDDGTARLADALGSGAPPGLDWSFAAHPELTHATIFRGLQLDGLRQALK